MPAMHLVRTDFPAPLSPQRAVTCPAYRSRSTFVSACTGPKCLSTPRALKRGSAAGDSLITWPIASLYRAGKGLGAAAHGGGTHFDLADARGGAGGRPGVGAQLRLVDELVLDDGVVHVRRVHPFRGQERSGLLAAARARWRLGCTVQQRCGRR